MPSFPPRAQTNAKTSRNLYAVASSQQRCKEQTRECMFDGSALPTPAPASPEWREQDQTSPPPSSRVPSPKRNPIRQPAVPWDKRRPASAQVKAPPWVGEAEAPGWVGGGAGGGGALTPALCLVIEQRVPALATPPSSGGVHVGAHVRTAGSHMVSWRRT